MAKLIFFIFTLGCALSMQNILLADPNPIYIADSQQPNNLPPASNFNTLPQMFSTQLILSDGYSFAYDSPNVIINDAHNHPVQISCPIGYNIYATINTQMPLQKNFSSSNSNQSDIYCNGKGDSEQFPDASDWHVVFIPPTPQNPNIAYISGDCWNNHHNQSLTLHIKTLYINVTCTLTPNIQNSVTVRSLQ